MKKSTKGDTNVAGAKKKVKARTKKRRDSTIEKEYKHIFSPMPLPNGGQYSDEDSLEQPSALRYVPSTTRTTVEMAIDFQMRQDAKLVRDF
jgi:hypothetical protein